MSFDFNFQDNDIIKLLDRFYKYVIIPDNIDECWIWVGVKNKFNYGQLKFYGTFEYAHRISYWLFKDFCKGNLFSSPEIKIRHDCNNPSCVNPSHLRKGTHKENMEDRAKRTKFCKNGHEYTLENTKINSAGYKVCRICIKSTSDFHNGLKPRLSDLKGMFK